MDSASDNLSGPSSRLVNPAEYKKGRRTLVAKAKASGGHPVNMRRHDGLYDRICSFENLFLASRKARKGKRGKDCVIRFESEIETELLRLRKELLDHSYRPGVYREFTIYDRKPRKISAAPYRDRVVHHALCSVIEPIFEKIFIHDSYACRTGKGTHKAVERFTKFARKNKYVLKCDIKKYFPSIDHAILFEKLRRRIKCKDTLWLIKLIIDGSNPQEDVIDYFQGDDLFSPVARRKGIPIGNLTSQFFANVYLNDFDHYVKRALKCRHYIRYVDDIVVFGEDKKKLWDIKFSIEEFLMLERLRLHPKKVFVAPISSGIDHLGYRIYPDYRLLRKDISMRFRKKLSKMCRSYKERLLGWEKLNASVQSWLGHARYADSYGIRRALLTNFPKSL